MALRPNILPGGLRIGLEEADGAADKERWPSDKPLAKDKLLLSSCLAWLVSKGKICNKGVWWGWEWWCGWWGCEAAKTAAAAADVTDDDKLTETGKLLVLLIEAGEALTVEQAAVVAAAAAEVTKDKAEVKAELEMDADEEAEDKEDVVAKGFVLETDVVAIVKFCEFPVEDSMIFF